MKAATIGIALTAAGWAACAGTAQAVEGPAEYDAVIAKHSAATGVPETLIRRVIVRESKYNPRAMNRGHYGMMQIKPATAKAMGYRGSAAGLLDADVNLTYGVRYLAGAYKVAGGNHDRAVRYYSSGYYYDAKRKGMLAQIGMSRDGALSAPPAPPVAVAAAPAPSPVARVATFFTGATQPAAAPQAAVPTPQARGPVPAQASASPTVVASVTPAAFVPVPQPRGPVAAAPVVQTAAAQPTAPLPPVRPADPKIVAPAAPVLASAAPAPSPRSRASDPVTTGSIAAVERPVIPMPPSRGTVTAQPAVASAAPATKTRVISPTAEPALASAGPVAPAAPKPVGQQPLAFAQDAPKVAPIPLRR